MRSVNGRIVGLGVLVAMVLGSTARAQTPPDNGPQPGYQGPPPGYYAPPPGYYAPPPGYYAPPPEPAPPPEERPHYVSLTFSPIHLFLPVVELQGEVALSRHVSVAVMGGYGSIAISNASVLGMPQRATASEAGGHFRYYAIGSFEHGMQVGAEVLWAHVAVDDPSVRVAGAASGLAVGPFVGYKIITRVGFTFDSQLGFEYIAARAQAHDTAGTSATANDSSVIPLVNLNIGWSF
jgi:hypothetical protein